jgi:hypothetical protein
MTRAGRKTKRRKSAAVSKTRPTVELLREFYTARLTASATAWGELMGRAPHRVTAVLPDDQPPYSPPESMDHTWTKDDELALLEHRQALAAWPKSQPLGAMHTYNLQRNSTSRPGSPGSEERRTSATAANERGPVTT